MVSTELIIPPRDPIRVYGGLHPLSNEHRQVDVPIGATIAEALEMVIAGSGLDWPYDHFVATVNDVRVPREYWERVRPKPGTVVVFRPVAAGDNSLRSLLFLGIAIAALFIAPVIGLAAGGFFAGATGTALIGGAITLAGAFLVNALVPLRPAQQESAQPKTLPMIAGASNEARPWGPVPVVLGRHRISPMYAAMPYSYFSGKDQHMNMLFCCGYGPLQITSMRIGETPVGQFEEVITQPREGRPNDADITVFTNNVDEQPLGITLKSADGYVFRTTADFATLISIDLIAPGGIWQYNKDNGSYDDRPVTINVQYRRAAKPGVAAGAWIARPDIVFHKERDTTRKGDQWDVATDTWDVQVRKATADYPTTGTEQVADTVVWQTLRSFEPGKPVKFKKPLALIGFRARATDQFNGVITTFNCIVASYVPHWNGTTWVTNQLSSNPADLFHWVLVGPANARPRVAGPLGYGDSSGQIDYDSIQRWGEDCTARGYTYNAVISDQRTVREVLADIAAAGRATVALRNGKWGVSFPRDTDPVSWHFTPRNSAGLKSTRTYRELPHALRVRWVNAGHDWRQEEGIVYNDNPNTAGMYDIDSAKLFESVEFPGITNWDNVHKAARYQLAQALLRPETHTLTADIESLRLERGDKVILSTDTLLIGTGYGRVTTTDPAGQTVHVDNRVIMEVGKAYQIKFTLSDGTFLTRRVLNTANETDWIKLDVVDTPPLASLQSIIADQDLTVGLRLLLEAGNAWSWPGTGQKWLDESGNGFDFFRGSDGTVSTNDPTFNGTPGAQTINEFWNFDGTDFFTYDKANEPWMNAIHQNNAKATILVKFYLSSLAAVAHYLVATTNSSTQIGFQFYVDTAHRMQFLVTNGTTVNYASPVTAPITVVGWHVAAFSIDEATATGSMMLDGVITAMTPTYGSPSAAAATFALTIGSAGGGAQTLPANDRIASVAAWQGVALTGAQLTALHNAIIATNDLMPPVGALFSFGESTKVTNDYRVLDVRPGPDLTAQFMLVDDAPGVEFLDPIPEYDPGITGRPDPYKLAPESLTYNERFEGSGITAKSTVQLTVIIPRVGTIRAFEFQYLDVDSFGVWTAFAVVNAPYLVASKDDLEAGVYNFRVRALFASDAVGQTNANDFSMWVYTGNINVLSTSSPPGNIGGGLSVNISGDVMFLEWAPVTDGNIAYYLVKFSPATDGSATWGESTQLLTTIDVRATVATRSGTYMVKAVTYSGVESAIALEHIVVRSAATPPNIVAEYDEAPYDPNHTGTPLAPFPGTHYSTQVQGGLLTLVFAGVNYTLVEGFYQFAQFIDLGSIYTSRITARINAHGIKSGDTMDHWTTLAGVVALDTTDPSQWSVETCYILSDGPTGKKSVIQRITDLGLTSGLKLCLEASAIASWPGSGQSWLDESGFHYDFFLGLDGAVAADDPSPPAATDTLLRSGGGNFYLGGGDYFTYDSVNEAWMNAIHQNNATFTAVVSFYMPALDTGIGHYLMGDTASGTQVGFQLYIYNNIVSFLVTNGVNVNYSVAASSIPITVAGFHTIGISINEATGLGTIAVDGAVQAISGIVYNTPSAAAATFKMQIAAAGNGAGWLANGWRMHAVAMWQGVALTSAQLQSIVSGIQNNDNWVFGAWTPFMVTDVTARIIAFGVRLKSADGAVSPAIDKLGVTIDMPDRHVGVDVKVPPGIGAPNGFNVFFDPAFKEVRSVAISNYDLDTASGEWYTLTWDVNHANIKFTRNQLVINKSFSLHAYGYGAVVTK